MRAIVAIGLVVAGLAGAAPGAAGPPAEAGPFHLVSLAALGRVDWRCDTAGRGHGLSFTTSRTSATTLVRLHTAGRTIRRATVHSSQSVRFPVLRARVQRLDFVQGTKPGTLRAFVTVDFEPGHPYTYCVPYVPPRLEVQLVPRT